MPANNLSENLENLSQSQGYKKFLGMPLIGSIASRKKKETTQKENKDSVSVPRKLLDKLLNQQQPEPQVEPLQTFNRDAEILTNIYNVMRMDHQTFMKNMIADKKFDKKLESIKESRTKELIEIFAGKKKEREQKEKVKREIEDLKKKLDELEKKKEARKAAEAPAPAPAPTVPAAPSRAPTTPPVPSKATAAPVPPTPVPAAPIKPSAPSAPITPAAPPVTPPAAVPVRPAAPTVTPSVTKAPEVTVPVATTAVKIGAGVIVSAGASSALAKIKGHEKFSAKAYPDPEKNPDGSIKKMYYSIGYGHQITESEVKQGFIQIGNTKVNVVGDLGKDTVLTLEQGEVLVKQDFAKYENAARAIPNFDKLNQPAQDALIDITYNMGVGWTKKFPSFMKSMENMQFEKAADELLYTDSSKTKKTGYYTQVKGRAEKNAELIKKGFDNKAQQVQPQLNVGEKIEEASKENKDLKRQSATPATPNAVVLNTVNNVTNGSKIYQTPTEDKNTSPVLQNQYK